MGKRKICVITGSRSEYDIVYSSIHAISDHKDLKLQIIATGTHLLKKFGYTYKEIESDGFKIDKKVKSLLPEDTLVSRAKSVGKQISGLSAALHELKPGIVLVAGDREEAISASVAASYLNIPVAHMAGGDTAFGSVDNTVRDATTKMSHIHFPMMKSHADRIIRMGEQTFRVHTVGHGGLDRFHTVPVISKKEVGKKLGIDMENGPVLLMIQHVLSSEWDQARFQIETTLSALAELKYKVVISYPNSDIGSSLIIGSIEKYRKKLDCSVYKNLPRNLFVNMLRSVDLLIGNSSLGVCEAPFLKLPVVNIGNRQIERVHSSNILYVEHNKDKIMETINTALFDNKFKIGLKKCKSIYGDGHTGEKIADILSKVKIDNILLNKPNL